MLVERVVEEVPQAQVALRHGLSEGAVEARLHRGKLALKRILRTQLREQAAPYGLAEPELVDGWQCTRIWCPTCGQRRLWGRIGGSGLVFELECRDCLGPIGGKPLVRNRLYDSSRRELFQGIKGFKPALNRQLDDLHHSMERWLARGCPPWRCHRCSAYVVRSLHWSPVSLTNISIAQCPQCGAVGGHTGTHGILHAHPAGRRFWREHPRLRSVPDQDVEVDGRPAIVSRLVSLTNSAELAMVLDAETFAVLEVDGPVANSVAPPPCVAA